MRIKQSKYGFKIYSLDHAFGKTYNVIKCVRKTASLMSNKNFKDGFINELSQESQEDQQYVNILKFCLTKQETMADEQLGLKKQGIFWPILSI